MQLITASTGLDDWEWGVTLFGVKMDDLKETVYTMRYDTASALYDFGPFYWNGGRSMRSRPVQPETTGFGHRQMGKPRRNTAIG